MNSTYVAEWIATYMKSACLVMRAHAGAINQGLGQLRPIYVLGSVFQYENMVMANIVSASASQGAEQT
jgi:hypothetical protein